MGTSQDVLEHLFELLNERQVRYVVARRYDKLPRATLGGDIDIYVRPADFGELVSVCTLLGFEQKNDSMIGNAVAALRQAIDEPKKAMRMLVASPSDVVMLLLSFEQKNSSMIGNTVAALRQAIDEPKKAMRMLVTSPYDIVSLIQGHSDQLYRDLLLHQNNIPLHLSDHLTYTSPYDGSQIRVDPVIEEQMFAHRRLYNGVYVPSPPDELAHIIPHCVFDKSGYFSEYYINRCDTLVNEVTTDESYDDRFRKLLSYLFYNADDLVYDLATSGEYISIRSRLRQFDDY